MPDLYRYLYSHVCACIVRTMKEVIFVGSSLDDLRAMPDAVRAALGVDLMIVSMAGIPGILNP